MKIEAVTRLQSDAIRNITYEQYAQVVASLDPNYVAAFELPNFLKGLWTDLKEVGTLLKESAEVGWEHIIKAFKEKSVFTLMKGVGFSVAKLLKAVKAAAAIYSNTMYRAIEDLQKVLGSSKTFQAMKIPERIAAFEKVLKSHPVLAKLSGTVIAGLLIFIYLKSSFTGHLDRDLSLVDAVVACIHGDFDLVDMFASPQGVHSLCCLLFGLATGGAGITSYGFSHAETMLHWLGGQAGNVYNILLALFYAAAKKLKMHFEMKHMPSELHSHRSQDWYHKLEPKAKTKYTKKYPGTKFVNKEKLIVPDANPS